LVDKDGVRTSPRSTEELQKLFPTIDTSYSSHIGEGEDEKLSPPVGAPFLPETEEDLYQRMSWTVDRLLENDHSENGENLCIVSHAPCLQMMALYLEGKKDPSSSSFGAWGMGGITRFSRPKGSLEWNCDFYSATDHMPGEYKAGVKGAWSLPSFRKG